MPPQKMKSGVTLRRASFILLVDARTSHYSIEPVKRRLHRLTSRKEYLYLVVPRAWYIFLSPSETGFIVSAHRLTKIILLTLIATL